MDTWIHALKVAGIGFAAVFLGLWMLAAGIKIMSLCCRPSTKKEREEA
jgi:Na+-transporting methylmalonyl-CoA/oxaloacetate decarboxylase gamma subunit